MNTAPKSTMKSSKRYSEIVRVVEEVLLRHAHSDRDTERSVEYISKFVAKAVVGVKSGSHVLLSVKSGESALVENHIFLARADNLAGYILPVVRDHRRTTVTVLRKDEPAMDIIQMALKRAEWIDLRVDYRKAMSEIRREL